MKDYKRIESLTLEECESYLKDSNLTQTERRYAEQHREEMMKWPWKKSIMEEFPEYGFRPTSLLLNTKTINLPMRIGWMFLCYGVAGIIMVVLAAIGKAEMAPGEALIPSFLFLFLSIPLFSKGKKEKKRLLNTPPRQLTEIADYVSLKKTQQFTHRNTFFVKNRKFGIMRWNLYNEIIVQISAEYDKLSWKEKNRILVAEKNGETFLIDIFGNRLS